MAKTCWVKGKFRLYVSQNPLYYIVCANCQMIVDVDIDWNVQCSGCSVFSPMEVKLMLPVILTDETTDIISTIKSPDAEKLCPYTAIEVRERQIEGLSLINEISIEMDNKEVVSFVKYYIKRGETLRRFVILKTYTLEEVTSFNGSKDPLLPTDSTLLSVLDDVVPDVSAPLSPASLSAHVHETQLITPPTKNVIQQINKDIAAVGSSSSQVLSAKRNIVFGTLSPAGLSSMTPTNTHAVPLGVVESPQKKTKGEYEIV